MAIDYLPEKLLPSKAKMKKLAKGNLSLNKAVLSSIANESVISRKSLEKTALKVLKKMKQQRNALEDFEGMSKSKATKKVLSKQELMLQRVQNAIVYEQTQAIKKKYKGYKYEWLPSDAKEPNIEHQLKYGRIFTIGKGEMPGERYGCRCGMRILTEDEELELD